MTLPYERGEQSHAIAESKIYIVIQDETWEHA